jgi:hypothetical protein
MIMSGAVTAAVVGAGAYAATAGTAYALTAGTAAAIGLGAGAMKMQYDAGEAQKEAGDKQLQAQKDAQQANLTATQAQAESSQMAINQANKKAPDTSALLASAAKSGVGGTMLTGPQGVDPNQLALAKNSLLGG